VQGVISKEEQTAIDGYDLGQTVQIGDVRIRDGDIAQYGCTPGIIGWKGIYFLLGGEGNAVCKTGLGIHSIAPDATYYGKDEGDFEMHGGFVYGM